MNTMQLWWYATRPKTLAASSLSVFLASLLALRYELFDFKKALFCLFFAMLSQVLSNFSNDYFDAIKGTDRPDRKGPLRVVAQGWISSHSMYRAIWIVTFLAFGVGLLLIDKNNLWLLGIGVSSILFAIGYTGGPFPLGYLGLGDLFVFIFFGLIAVSCSFYVQSGFLTIDVFCLACAYGLLASNILAITSYRDIDTDKLTNKRTLGVIFGRGFVEWQYAISFTVALSIPFVLYIFLGYSIYILIPVVVAFKGYFFIKNFKQKKDKLCFVYGLKETVCLLIIYVLLLVPGILL